MPSNSKIEILPEYVIDQIKACEIIERPASLVKEIIENSLDANSKNLSLKLHDNGMDCIHLEDDGLGMSYSDLPLAFHRHATSKIRTLNDIYALSSYGFRGEALASIAGVARISCLSSPTNLGAKGGRYIIDGGRVKEHSPYNASRPGTSLFIKDLFYNTPVRLKFLKSKTAEKNALLKVIHSFVMTNPLVSFSVKWDTQEKSFYPALNGRDKKERIEQIFYRGKTKNETTHYISGDYESYRVEIFISSTSTKSFVGKQQYIFVNNRLVEDKGLHHTITKGLPHLWPSTYSGHYCVFIKAPAGEVDVNIHPNKTSVKFFKPEIVYSLTKSLLTKISSPSTPRLNTPSPSKKPAATDESESSQEKFLELHPTLSLLLKQGRYHFIDNQRIFSEIVQKLIEQKLGSDHETTPLLISETFLFGPKDNKKIDYIKSLCFEIDFLDNTHFVIKSFPDILAETPFIELIHRFFGQVSAGPIPELFLQCARRISFRGPALYRYLANNPRTFIFARPIDTTVVKAVFNDFQ